MKATNELLKKMNTYINEQIEDNRLALLVEQEMTELPTGLELIKVEVSIKKDRDGSNEFECYTNTFRLDENVIKIDVFASQTGLENFVYLRDSYDIVWYDGDSLSVEDNKAHSFFPQDDYGIPDFLNSINYSAAFNGDAQLLKNVETEYLETINNQLFALSKGILPGLIEVKADRYERAELIFETGAELPVSVEGIYRAIEKANHKKELA